MSDATIEAVLARLTAMDRAALGEQWKAVFGSPPPKGCQSPLLRGALAWHAQAQAARPGASLDRLLRSLGPQASSRGALAPGIRLIREWQGTTHQVTVQTAGFEYAGRSYRSLTAIARAITGTSWSGPSFFGLRP